MGEYIGKLAVAALGDNLNFRRKGRKPLHFACLSSVQAKVAVNIMVYSSWNKTVLFFKSSSHIDAG